MSRIQPRARHEHGQQRGHYDVDDEGFHSERANGVAISRDALDPTRADLFYINAQVGTPELKFVDNPSNKKTRWVDVQIPVREGNRYRIGNLEFAGNTIVKTEALRPLFKLKAGEYYSHKEITKGFQKAQEMYGAVGYMEFTGYPEPKPRDAPDPAAPEAPAALAAEPPKPKGPPIVDLTLRVQEGKQYFVNRIVFVGNTTTRDSVIRREMRLYENGVFNSEALKYSIRRLNQLGYFKALEGPPKDVTVDKTSGQDTRVDVRLQLQEQNRNQLTFGAGVSQYEGFFGQLSFQTSNFLGRGESLTVAVQAGSRAQNYTLAFTEPFLFDRNITGGLNLFRNEVRYIGQFTQQSIGGVLTFGFPIGNGFTRMFANYSYEQTRVSEINAADRGQLYEQLLSVAKKRTADADMCTCRTWDRLASRNFIAGSSQKWIETAC